MLTLKKTPDYTYTWPVKIPFPKDGGGIDHAEFTATFRYKTSEAVQAIRDRLEAGSDAIAAFGEIVTDWDGIKDEEGNAVPYDREALNALLKLPSAPYALMEAYAASLRGIRAKN